MCRSLAYVVQFVTISSSGLLSPGHQIDDLARIRHLTTPWGPSSSLSNISSLMQFAFPSLTPCNTCSCCIVSSFWTCQYGFRVPGRERKVGRPSKQYVITWRHTSSSCWFALISANLVSVAGICPKTRFACSETSSANCDSSAVSGRTEGERDRTSAVSGRTEGERHRASAVSGRTEGERDRASAVSGRTEGERDRASAVSGRTEGERDRASAVSGRTEGERDRASAVSGRTEGERERASAVSGRTEGERDRASAVSGRTEGERDRASATTRFLPGT